jgi:hypothetical protein
LNEQPRFFLKGEQPRFTPSTTKYKLFKYNGFDRGAQASQATARNFIERRRGAG